MKKISKAKATREAAANICNALASWWETDNVGRYPNPRENERIFSKASTRLAGEAKYVAWSIDASPADQWLLAEALIREGWTP